MSHGQSAGVSVTDAVKRATQYLQQFYPNAQDVLVEEVELSDVGGDYWLITLGFADPTYKPGIVGALAPERKPRVYKVFKIRRDSGEIESMKIRECQNV